MRWSETDNRWEHDVYKCGECDRDINYDHRRGKKNFPQGMQTASQLLLIGFLAGMKKEVRWLRAC